LTRVVCIHRDFTCLFFEENGTIPFYRRFLKKVFIRKFHELTRITKEESGKAVPYGVFSKSNYGRNGSFQVRAEGSTRGRVELRPRAGAVPKPFEKTP
jgi:hypothetical protein